MTDPRQAMQMALRALELRRNVGNKEYDSQAEEAIGAMRATLSVGARMPEPTDTLRRQSADLTARILEIEEALAQSKRDFFAGGKGMAMRERAELEAERAELRVTRHKVNGALEADKARAKAQSQGAFIAALCKELETRGLESIIALAKQKLADQVEAG